MLYSLLQSDVLSLICSLLTILAIGLLSLLLSHTPRKGNMLLDSLQNHLLDSLKDHKQHHFNVFSSVLPEKYFCSGPK